MPVGEKQESGMDNAPRAVIVSLAVDSGFKYVSLDLYSGT